MMQKEELLKQIKDLAAQRLITRDEIVLAYEEGLGARPEQTHTRQIGVSEILYYIGGAIVFLGISVLIRQNWSTLNIWTKILATLGSGVAAYFVGVLFSHDEKLLSVGQAFYLVSALVTPIGLYVVFDHAGFDMGSHGTQSLISSILSGTYLLSYFVFRKNLFIVFNIIFGTWLFFSFSSYLVGTNPYFDETKFFEYRVLLAGLSYMLLGYFFSQDKQKLVLSGPLYGFGVLGFLGAALALGGWSPSQNIFWELVFPGLVFGVILLSVYVKSKAFLTFGSIYLMIYIPKITAEYFTKGLGWPLALVLAGLLLIATGHATFYLHKKYIS